MSDNPYEAPKANLSSDTVDVNEPGYYGYAGFWKRFVAAIIDAIITSLIGGVIGFAFGIALIAMETNQLGVLELFGNLIGVVIGWLYFALLESSDRQATPGKMVMGIRVTDLNGEKISFGRATGRHFGKILSTLILLIGFIMVGFTEKKQGLHDILASCLVVNNPST